MSLGIQANKEKIGALMAYIAIHRPGTTLDEMMSMLYLIDVEFMKKRGFPLTWLDWYVGEHDPVAPDLYEMMTKE